MPSIEVTPSPQGVPGAVNDPTRINGDEITFAGAGSTEVNGYLARPADAASHPGIVVIHEAGGLNEHIRDVSTASPTSATSRSASTSTRAKVARRRPMTARR